MELGWLIDTAHIQVDDGGHPCYPNTTDSSPYVLVAQIDRGVFECEFWSDLTSWGGEHVPFWVTRSASDYTVWRFNWNLSGVGYMATLRMYNLGERALTNSLANAERWNTGDSMYADFQGMEYRAVPGGSWLVWLGCSNYFDTDSSYNSYDLGSADAYWVRVSNQGSVRC